MKDKSKRKFTQLGLHIEGIELDIKKRDLIEAAMGSSIRKLLQEMKDIRKYGFVKDIKIVEPVIGKLPFEYGIVIDIDGHLLTKLNNTNGIL